MCGGNLELTLHYFDFRGKAEAIRILMNYMDCDYTEKIISMEEWPKVKGTYPGGQLPVLDIDCGCSEEKTRIFESDAILMRLAKFAEIAGDKDHVTLYKTMAVFGICNDMQGKFATWYMSPEKERPAVMEGLMRDVQPVFVRKLEEVFTGRCFLGDDFSVADIRAYSMLEKLVDIRPDFLKIHSPKLQTFYEKFPEFAGDKVKKYLADRKKYALPI